MFVYVALQMPWYYIYSYYIVIFSLSLSTR